MKSARELVVVVAALAASACGGAPRPQTLALGHGVRGDTTRAASTHTPPCAPDEGAPDARWSFRAPRAGRYAFRAAGYFDTVLTVRTARGAVLGCADDSPRDQSSAEVAEVAVDLRAGDDVVAVVDGYRGDRGTYDVSVRELVPLAAGGVLTEGTQVSGDTSSGGAPHEDTWHFVVDEEAVYSVAVTADYPAYVQARRGDDRVGGGNAGPDRPYRETLTFERGEVTIDVGAGDVDAAGRYTLRVDRADRPRAVEDPARVAAFLADAETLTPGARAVLLDGGPRDARPTSIVTPSCGVVDGHSEVPLRLDLAVDSAVVLEAHSTVPLVLELRRAAPASGVVACVHGAPARSGGFRYPLSRRMPAGSYVLILDADVAQGAAEAVALHTVIIPLSRAWDRDVDPPPPPLDSE